MENSSEIYGRISAPTLLAFFQLLPKVQGPPTPELFTRARQHSTKRAQQAVSQ
jgi:hypothetical protein